ncbi:MAG TPA: c-type cytochrome [Xanthomonadales bacterium]|nr:c-type cytochrome [Xanthomonadales bacterium]
MFARTLIFTAVSTLMFATGAVHAEGDAARGKELSVDCADCHGEDGKGDEFTVGIAGLDEAYHVEQLKKFKSGERTDEDEMMIVYTEELSEQDMQDLAAYYATLPKQ